MSKPLKLSEGIINALRTKRGGWTKKSLASMGVPWPPPKGWKRALINGRPIPVDRKRKLIPMNEVISKYEVAQEVPSSCTPVSCTYPDCKCPR